MDRYVTKAEFSRIASISRAAVGKLTKEGGRLFEAMTPEGRIDTGHPAVVDYLRDKADRLDSSSVPIGENVVPITRDRLPQLSTPSTSGAEASRYELENFKLHQQGFKLQLENAERVGQVVTREFVMAGFYRPCETLFTQLLGDFVKSSIGILQPMILSGCDRLEAEKKLREQVSNFLKPARQRMTEAVKELYGEHEAEAARR